MATDQGIETFLAQAEPDNKSNRFVIGGFESGITIYKQQVRALNLIYSLHEKRRIQQNAKIAIIGGGLSGVTAAVAAAALGYEVYLFERRPILLHLQHGCDTRWVHPHIYNWPAYGAERPYAGLPLLDWRESTAGSVVEQIQRDYERIKKKIKGRKIHEHPGAIVSISKKNPKRVAWSDSFGSPKNGELPFAAVIFAVGFGVERQVDSGSTTSYWRNDSINQLKPGASANAKTVYVVSGTGDGGLIDLLRTRIQSFNQGRIIEDMITSSKETRTEARTKEELLSALRKIAEQWEKRGASVDDTWLFDQYTDLDEKFIDLLMNRLKGRLRKDTEVILNGKEETLSQAIRLDRASMFNTLMTYVLFSRGEFRYEGGECKLVDTGIALIGNQEIRADYIIIRHGTDQKTVFEAAGFKEGVEVLKKEDSLRQQIDTSRSLWPAGWWAEKAKNVLSGVKQEFVPPATRAIATTFVSTLSDIIGPYKSSKSARFRITLHRLTSINEEEFFQQISHYAGTKTSGAVGRVFSVNEGLVGLVCRMGQPIIVQREEDFDRLWEYLHLDNPRPIDGNVKSLLACPFFAPVTSGSKPKHISLVLFMDSEQKEFFTQEVLGTVYAACKGFVQNLEAMKSKDDLLFASSDYSGYAYTKNRRPDEAGTIKKYKSVRTENEVFKNFIEDLTFETVSYFDAYLR
jgi:hypothetical protein